MRITDSHPHLHPHWDSADSGDEGMCERDWPSRRWTNGLLREMPFKLRYEGSKPRLGWVVGCKCLVWRSLFCFVKLYKSTVSSKALSFWLFSYVTRGEWSSIGVYFKYLSVLILQRAACWEMRSHTTRREEPVSKGTAHRYVLQR